MRLHARESRYAVVPNSCILRFWVRVTTEVGVAIRVRVRASSCTLASLRVVERKRRAVVGVGARVRQPCNITHETRKVILIHSHIGRLVAKALPWLMTKVVPDGVSTPV